MVGFQVTSTCQGCTYGNVHVVPCYLFLPIGIPDMQKRVEGSGGPALGPMLKSLRLGPKGVCVCVCVCVHPDPCPLDLHLMFLHIQKTRQQTPLKLVLICDLWIWHHTFELCNKNRLLSK